MNPALPTILGPMERDEIIVLGFDGSFSECLINYSDIEKGFRIKEFENSFVAFQWLEMAIVKFDKAVIPKAIICEFAFLEEENFLLLNNLKDHSVLRYLPLIAMNRDGLNHKLEALHLGFDDYYDVPVQWEVLRQRIDFLTAFKQEVEASHSNEAEQFSISLSLAKRVFDILFSAVVLLMISPLLFLIALLIKAESPGPVIYRSKRVGAGYKVFDFFKFRSMYRNADQRMRDLEHLNQYNNSKEGGLFVKYNNDPRVTKIGRIIRKTSIDELPQLFNILKGDMSIVGNRPLPVYEAELLTRDVWAKRFLAPAGLTGLWQVTKRGKNDMSSEERINLDVTYAEKHSFWYDLKIILKTPFALIQEENV